MIFHEKNCRLKKRDMKSQFYCFQWNTWCLQYLFEKESICKLLFALEWRKKYNTFITVCLRQTRSFSCPFPWKNCDIWKEQGFFLIGSTWRDWKQLHLKYKRAGKKFSINFVGVKNHFKLGSLFSIIFCVVVVSQHLCLHVCQNSPEKQKNNQ